MTYTIRDVARLAGVSISTVSAVLNGNKPVSSDLRGRIEDAIGVLDYFPDQNARSLKARSSNVVGVVVPDVRDAFFTELMHVAEEEARRRKMCIALCNTEGDSTIEYRQLDLLLSNRVAGILLSCADSFVA